ncbi:hypothetical protein JNM87_05175, partial [Candidatus Saccharibacteria bacterium]|nr:hypothetical protein [Candidatus Saccharibacteria bacterium]
MQQKEPVVAEAAVVIPKPRFDSDKLLTKGVEMPAIVLDKTLEAGAKVAQAVPNTKG